jgi:hypothetical protein
MEKFTKFQSIYKEITGDNINWADLPENLREVFLNSSGLNAQEVAKLPKNIRIAYLISQKPPDNVILDKIKKRLTFYEDKYGTSSENFYRKHHNSETIFDGDREQVRDFLLWHDDYERYLELKNAIR